MTNRLAGENSPYLLQHAENPVDWFPWGNEALEKARREDKPIFLSIGYAACHWCHVMAHESFEDPRTAAFMNERFINIKVDREERPDLDSIYMNAVVAMTGQGGWPMSVFLTPEGQPFFGGTYFPPIRRYNMPSFRDLLQGIDQAWRQDRERLLQAGAQMADHLRQSGSLPGAGEAIHPRFLEQAAMRLVQSYDWQTGGWGRAPKFPQAMAIEFLLRRASRGDRLALDLSVHLLDATSAGGLFDVVGGGFARYSTDDRWLVPHFEKMLYDNALLARAYLHAYLLTGSPAYLHVCEKTLNFLTREMMTSSGEDGKPSGGFFSSLDADSEGEEGKYYLWTPSEIQAAIPEPEEANFILAAYGVQEQGNFEGRNILQRTLTDEELAGRFHLNPDEIPSRLETLHTRLLNARQDRIAPGKDDKVLAAWNGLALIAFAEAGRYLKRPDFLDVARQNADFLLTELHPGDRLLRSWRQGNARHNAYLEDYGALILGLVALYQSDPDPWWFNSALELVDEMLANYRDPQGGFFDTRADQGDLITRPRDLEDNATPSGSSLAAAALLELAELTGQSEWRETAEQMLSQIQAAASRYPTAFGQWLTALDFATGPVHEVAILGDRENPATRALLDVAWSKFRPYVVLAASPYPPPANAPALLQDRPLIAGLPTAYVCSNFVCLRPVTAPEDFQAQIESLAKTNDTGQ